MHFEFFYILKIFCTVLRYFQRGNVSETWKHMGKFSSFLGIQYYILLIIVTVNFTGRVRGGRGRKWGETERSNRAVRERKENDRGFAWFANGGKNEEA